MTPIIIAGFLGEASALDPHSLPESVGVASRNQHPDSKGDGRSWHEPVTVPSVAIGPSSKTIYRLGRDIQNESERWLSWATPVSVTRGFDATDSTERTYFTGDGSPKWTNNVIGAGAPPYPSAVRELAVPAPTVAPTATLFTDGPSGNVAPQFYVFTWVNDIGWESAPSPASASLTVKPGAVVSLTPNNTPPVGAYGITTLRWYRSQIDSVGNVELHFLRDYPVGTAGQQDDARSLGEPIPSQSWLPLAATAANLTECWAQFASATVDKTVRFCEPGFIYAWPLAYEYVLANTPVASAAFQQRLVVFTKAGAEVFTGIDQGVMDQRPLAVPACVSQRSVQGTEYGVFWVSNDGVIYLDTQGATNLTAGAIKPEDWKASYAPSTSFGVLWKGMYLCFLGPNAAGIGGLAIDPRNRNGVYPFSLSSATAAYFDPLLSEMFIADNGVLKKWHPAGGSPMAWSFKSKLFRHDQHVEPEWFDVLASGNATVNLYVDGALKMARTVPTGRYRTPDGVYGRDVQIEVLATTPVQMVSVE